jgi:hypothetical protein
MINDYLRSAGYEYSQSVFSEESLAGAMPSLTDDELLEVLHISKTSTLYNAIITAKATSTSAQGACFLLALLEAVAEVAHGGRGSEAGTQTGGSDRYHLEVRVMLMLSANPAVSPWSGLEALPSFAEQALSCWGPSQQD